MFYYIEPILWRKEFEREEIIKKKKLKNLIYILRIH